MRDLAINGGVTLADTKYRTNLVGAGGKALNDLSVPAAGPAHLERAAVDASLAPLPGPRRLGLAGCAAWSISMAATTAATTPGPISTSRRSRRDLPPSTAASASAVQGMPGRSSCGARTCSTRTSSRSRSTPRSREAARRAAVAGGLHRPSRSTQLYNAFLGEPRTFGVTLRAKLGFNRPAPVALTPPPPAAAAAAGNPDLPRRIGDPSDGDLPGPAASAAAPASSRAWQLTIIF